MTSSFKPVIDLAEGTGSPSLLTRDQGRELRLYVIKKLQDTDSVVLDLTHVEALSPSFADELFGGLNEHLGQTFRKRIQISCPKAEWRRLISSVLQYRQQQKMRSPERPTNG